MISNHPTLNRETTKHSEQLAVLAEMSEQPWNDIVWWETCSQDDEIDSPEKDINDNTADVRTSNAQPQTPPRKSGQDDAPKTSRTPPNRRDQDDIPKAPRTPVQESGRTGVRKTQESPPSGPGSVTPGHSPERSRFDVNANDPDGTPETVLSSPNSKSGHDGSISSLNLDSSHHESDLGSSVHGTDFGSAFDDSDIDDSAYDLSLIKGLVVDKAGRVCGNDVFGELWRGRPEDAYGKIVGDLGEVRDLDGKLVARMRLLGRDPPMEDLPYLHNVIISGSGDLYDGLGLCIGAIYPPLLRSSTLSSPGMDEEVRDHLHGYLIGRVRMHDTVWHSDWESKRPIDTDWVDAGDQCMVGSRGAIFDKDGIYKGEVVTNTIDGCAGMLVDTMGNVLDQDGEICGRGKRFKVERLAGWRWQQIPYMDGGSLDTFDEFNSEEKDNGWRFMDSSYTVKGGKSSNGTERYLNQNGVRVAQTRIELPNKCSLDFIHPSSPRKDGQWIQLTDAGREMFHWRARSATLNSRLERLMAKSLTAKAEQDYTKRVESITIRAKIRKRSGMGGMPTQEEYALTLLERERRVRIGEEQLRKAVREAELIQRASFRVGSQFAPLILSQAAPAAPKRQPTKDVGTNMPVESNLQEEPAFADFYKAQREGRSRLGRLTPQAKKKLNSAEHMKELLASGPSQPLEPITEETTNTEEVGRGPKASSSQGKTATPRTTPRYDQDNPKEFHQNVVEDVRAAIGAGLDILRIECEYLPQTKRRGTARSEVEEQEAVILPNGSRNVIDDTYIPGGRAYDNAIKNQEKGISRLGNGLAELTRMVERLVSITKAKDIKDEAPGTNSQLESVRQSGPLLMSLLKEIQPMVSEYETAATAIANEAMKLRRSTSVPYTESDQDLVRALGYLAKIKSLDRSLTQLREKHGNLLIVCTALQETHSILQCRVAEIYDDAPEDVPYHQGKNDWTKWDEYEYLQEISEREEAERAARAANEEARRKLAEEGIQRNQEWAKKYGMPTNPPPGKNAEDREKDRKMQAEEGARKAEEWAKQKKAEEDKAAKDKLDGENSPDDEDFAE